MGCHASHPQQHLARQWQQPGALQHPAGRQRSSRGEHNQVHCGVGASRGLAGVKAHKGGVPVLAAAMSMGPGSLLN